MKTISIHAFNRPALLRLTLAGLSQNTLHGFDRIFIGLDGGKDLNVEAWQIACDFADRSEVVCEIVTYPEKVGSQDNPYRLIEKAFELGSEFHVVLEEDTLLAPDALDLARWYANNCLDLPALCLCFSNAFSWPGNPVLPWTGLEGRPNRVFVGPTGILPYFNDHGWACTEAGWRTLRLEWAKAQPMGYDCAFGQFFRAHPDINIVQPQISRSVHTGDVGIHVDPVFHWYTSGRIQLARGPRVKEFVPYFLQLPLDGRWIDEILGYPWAQPLGD